MAKPARPWRLEEKETFSSYGSWKYNIVSNIKKNTEYAPFVSAQWQKSAPNNPTRGLAADAEENGLSAEDKLANLENMLGFIAQHVPHFLTYNIIHGSTSLESVWECIRKYYGFKKSESQFMKYAEIKWEDDERPERLYQRLVAHIQDNLLTTESTMTHHNARVTSNEMMSPTVERLIVLQWMQLIHPGLPALVQQSFAFQLQDKTLTDLQPRICDNIDKFLGQLKAEESMNSSRAKIQEMEEDRMQELEDVRVSRTQARGYGRPSRGSSSSYRSHQTPQSRNKFPSKPQGQKICRMCKAEGRRYIGHSLPDCDYVSTAEKKGLISVRSSHISEEDNYDPSDEFGACALESPQDF